MSSAWVDLDRLADGVTDAILKYIERQGYAIVPAASVVSEADRAAVGRLAARAVQSNEWMEYVRFDDSDIEAAQRVADGGK